MGIRLSVTIDKELLDALMKVSKAKTKRAAIEQALRHYVQTRRLEELTMMIEKRPLNLSEADLRKWRQSGHART